jgi:peptidoglycan/LPS O-acetylase OafA/YrhL
MLCSPKSPESNEDPAIAVAPGSVASPAKGFRDLSNDGSRDLANLDFLRAVAVSLVFFDHLFATMNVRGFGDVGQLGVLIFFVHTSLVLMLSMGRLKLSGSRLFSVFLIRRVFRIYPLSIVAVLATATFRVPAACWTGGYEWIGWPSFISNFFLTQNLTQSISILSVLWSLPFEMQMYLVLPFLFLLLSRFRSIKSAFAIWLLGIVIACADWAIHRGIADLNFLLTRYVPCFLAGVIAWRIMTTQRRRPPLDSFGYFSCSCLLSPLEPSTQFGSTDQPLSALSMSRLETTKESGGHASSISFATGSSALSPALRFPFLVRSVFAG